MRRGRRGRRTRELPVIPTTSHIDFPLENVVFNLSNKQISSEQIDVLSKGLSFVPTVATNPFNVKIELFRFLRNVKLKGFFSPREVTPSSGFSGTSEHRFKPKSTFIPFVNNPSVSTFCRLVEKEIDDELQKNGETPSIRKKHNLSKIQKVAIDNLMNDSTITIQRADKGGGIVILNTETYIEKITSMLADKTSYTKLLFNPTNNFNIQIKNTLSIGLQNKWLSEQEFKFLINKTPTTPILYALPKIHKSPLDPPFRPIVSGIGSLTEKISRFVDYHIYSIVQTLPSYLKDTTDFLTKLQHLQHLLENDWFVTLDVTSLYTNIPHEGGLEALKFYLSEKEGNIPSDYILDLTNLVLTKNYFLFEKKYYLQIQGTAMGTPLAPNYANLFMGKFELDYIYNNNPFRSYIKHWSRFIDDCFLIWTGNENQLNDFFDYVNSRMPSISFTMEKNKNTIHFLDVEITKKENKLNTTVYRKPTDKNTILSADSHHPLPLKKSLPVSQLHRLRRICDSEDEFDKQADSLLQRFQTRGYPVNWLSEAYQKVKRLDRKQLFQKNTNKQKKPFSVNYVLTYNESSNVIKSIVKKHWHILSSDTTLNSAFQNPPLFTYKRGRNLSNMLVRSDVIREKTEAFIKGCFPCRNCAACSTIIKSNYFTCPRTNKRFDIKSCITCNTKNVIYLLRCPCYKIYCGKTSRSLKIRIGEHKSAIRRKDITSPVAKHFAENGHSVDQLQCIGIEKISQPRRGGDLDRKLLQREAFWIYRLNGMSPNNLNEEFDLTCFL